MGCDRRHAPRAVACALALALAACGGGHATSDGTPRNLILISLDTLRPDHLGCYGYGRETSPAIDRLAKEGVRFADASSAAPWTLPSHTTMFTGLYPSHHGVKDYSHRLPQSSTTLAEILRDRGFQTYCVVNTWNIADPRFEIFQGFDPEHIRYVHETRVEPGRGQVIENSGEAVAAEVREFLAGRERARPFFLFAHFYDAHSDFQAREEYRRRFVGPYSGPLDGSTAQLMELRARGVSLGAADVRFLEEMYDAEIRQLDDVLAQLFEFFEREGLTSDTLIALVSDHGEEFYEHGGLLHGRTQYQELLAVPMILKGPGIPAARVVAQPVGLVDLMPTLLACLGLPRVEALDGIDLSDLWRTGAPEPKERFLFGEADHNNVVDGQPVIDIKRMARLGREKLLLDRHSEVAELYDLVSDPSERHDRAAVDPERVRFLRLALARFLDGQVAGETSGQELTPEERQLLEALGYAGGK